MITKGLTSDMKRRLGLAAAVLAAGFAALNFVAYRQVYSMTHFVANAPPVLVVVLVLGHRFGPPQDDPPALEP